MPHYLSQVSYTPEAWARLVANPHDRIEAVRGPIEKLGGRIHRLEPQDVAEKCAVRLSVFAVDNDVRARNHLPFL